MLLKNVKNIHKNHIIFNHNGNEFYEKIDNDNKLNVFNANFMNIYLDQFTETIGTVTYNDIVQISVLENHDIEIKNLPHKLKSLNIMSSTCTKLELSTEVRNNIISITIDKSNIRTFPDISNCINLQICKINHSAITEFNINYDLPDFLRELSLQCNLIRNQNFAYDKLLDKIQTLKINLSDNYLKYDDFPEKLRIKCNLIRQETYIHNRISFENVANLNIRNFVYNAPNEDTKVIDPLFGGQNVHLSSVNKSVLNSVGLMKEFVNEHNIKITQLSKRVISTRTLDLFDCSAKTDLSTFHHYFQEDYELNRILLKDMEITTVNIITKMTYKATFELIWSIINFKHRLKQLNLDDAVERIKTEIKEGSILCFTGKYNRLVNSMVGIIEGVLVGFSKSEELQLEFGKLIERFNKDKEYTFDKAYCDAKTILEFTDKNTRQTWLDAIYDLKPDNKKITYNGQKYLKTWDDDVLEIYGKELIGYFEEEKIIFLCDF